MGRKPTPLARVASEKAATAVCPPVTGKNGDNRPVRNDFIKVGFFR
jgi:hypothetical protein